MHLARTALLPACLTLLAGCGGSNDRPTTPATDDGVPLVVRDGRTGAPVAPALLDTGRATEIVLPGFLTLRTGRRSGELFLWPDDAGLPAEFTRALAYWGNNPGVSYRWPDGVMAVAVAPEGEFLEGRAAQALEAGMGLASRAHPNLEFARGGGDRTVSVSWNPDDPTFRTYPNALAFADVTWNGGGVLTGGRIVFRFVRPPPGWENQEEQWWRALGIAAAHELIHASGLLGHVPPGSPGIMGTDGSLYASTDFSDAEKLVMRMHYRRPPGMRLAGSVEEEPGLTTQAVREGRIIIVD